RIAHSAGMKGRGVDLYLVSATALRGVLVTLPASHRIEQWSEPRPGREHRVEHHAVRVESRPLGVAQTADRVAGLERFFAAEREERGGRQRPNDGAAGHGWIVSMVSVMSPVAVAGHPAR